MNRRLTISYAELAFGADRSLSVRTDIAWAAIIVDAKDEGVSPFYRQFGFQPFLDDPLHLFLPRRVVEKLFIER